MKKLAFDNQGHHSDYFEGPTLVKWPLSDLFVIGLFIAIEVITNRWSYLIIVG